MAQDYHIYIHSETSGNGGGNKTTPFSAKQDTPFSTKALNTVSQAKNMVNGGLVSTGVATLKKVLPVSAVAIASIKVTDKILSIGFAHQEEYTGSYKNNVNYNNTKTIINNALHPIQYYLQRIHREAQFNKQNREIAQQNRLIGNSILKDFNIGV